MVFLYNLAVRLYYLLILLFSTFNPKAKLWINGRKKWSEKMEEAIDNESEIVWFHCASLGEFEQGRPLMEEYKKDYPNRKILVTFFSPSGYEVRKNYTGADYVFYLPPDTKRNAARFIAIVNPVAAIFIKYEFWFHFLSKLKGKNIPTYLVSAIFRPSQIFFKNYGLWTRNMLHTFTHIFVQDFNSLSLLKNIGIQSVTVAGDTRFDRVYETAQTAKRIPILDQFCENSRVLVAGSTWPKDEELLKAFIEVAPQDVKLIVAPHEVNSTKIDNFLRSMKQSSVKFSEYNEKNTSNFRVLVIDSIGLLASAYGYGKIAYVGGGFGVGIHNTLEPASFGIPIVFGPNYHKFSEAKELIARGAAFSVKNEDELKFQLLSLLTDHNNIETSGIKAKEFVLQNIGTTKTILLAIKQ